MSQTASARIVLFACLLALLSFMTSTSLATVGPFVKVRLLGEPRFVQPGKPFQGKIEIVAGEEAIVSGLRFERPLLADGSKGEGPLVLSWDAPSITRLGKAESLVVGFEVLFDPSEPLTLSFEFDGAPVTKRLDLSWRHYAAMTSGVPTVEHPDAEALASAESPVQRDRTSIPRIQGGDERADDTRTVRVHGRLAYVRRGTCADSNLDSWPDTCSNDFEPCHVCSVTSGRICSEDSNCPTGETCLRGCADGYEGADAVDVRVKDDALGTDPLLVHGVTDSSGYFDLSFSTDGTPDIYVEFETKNGVVHVEDATWERNYKFETSRVQDYEGTSLNFGLQVPDENGMAIALHNSITRVARWYHDEEGVWAPKVDVQWPDGGGTRYGGDIHVNPGEEWDIWVHAHEWGHFWTDTYGEMPDIDYCNQICDGPGCSDEGHCLWCTESERIAWVEGWADWLADAFMRSFRGRYGSLPNGRLLNLEDLPIELGDLDCNTADGHPCPCDPYDTEAFLAALLRDIEDSPRALYFPGEIFLPGEVRQHDSRLLPGEKVTIRVNREANLVYQGTLDPLVRLRTCDVAWICNDPHHEDNDGGSDTPPGPGRNALIEGWSNAGNFRIDVLGADDTIGPYLAELEYWDDIDFDGVGDELALGTDEIFSIARTEQPITPHEFLSVFLSRYPAYLKPFWATATNNRYYVHDGTAPGAPTDLTSTTHTIGDPSARAFATYTWTPAEDDVAGIRGYCATLSHSPAMPPECTSAGTDQFWLDNVSSFTNFDRLTVGDWYFNIRAVDRAGNWSSTYASFGPITIVLACDLHVDMPNGGQSWRIGTFHDIYWSCINRDVTLYGYEPVTIDLLRGGVFYRTIGNSEVESRNWEVPIDVAPGDDYQIRITSRDVPEDTDTSDANFSITGDLIDNGDGTVSHVNSCLMWHKDAGGAGPTRTWDGANDWARGLGTAGHHDWRMPSGSNLDGSVCNSRHTGGNCPETELGTLYFLRLNRPGSLHPFTNVGWHYWTATLVPGDPTRAMMQDMLDGGQIDEPRSDFALAWPVRTIPGCTPTPEFPDLRIDGDGDGFFEADDCDDTNFRIHPLAQEVCGDSVDNDCDGYVDELCNCGDGLEDNGDGTVTELSTCLMWLKDFDQAGTDDWPGAMDLAASFVFAGHDDWRLPDTLVPDDGCTNPSTANGYDCSGSEMGHLHYATLGNLAQQSPGCTGPFLNYDGNFWSRTEYAPDTSLAYYFMFDDAQYPGVQFYQQKAGEFVPLAGVLPVRVDEFCVGDLDDDGHTVETDCDDTDPTVYAGAWEICDGQDNDCDGLVDEESAVGDSCSVGLGACESIGTRICGAEVFGTKMLADVRPGSEGSLPEILGEANGLLFFAADDGSQGSELWISDGTREGTAPVLDINPGPTGSGVVSSATVGDRILFGADDGSHGNELWKSDGTPTGTTLVTDLYPDATGSEPAEFTNLAGTLVFTAVGDTATGRELWKSDGTSGGTAILRDVYGGPSSSDPGDLTTAGATLFFAARDKFDGRELWKSDGTPAGTTQVKDIFPGIGSSNPQDFAVLGSIVLFQAGDGPAGTELWKSDGTAFGTVRVRDINPSSADSNPTELIVVGGVVFFAADDGTHGIELWKSDGTSLGTTLVADVRSGADGSQPHRLTAVGSTLFFWADDGVHGTELWKSDGTGYGTTMVAELAAGPADSEPTDATELGGALVFSASEASLGIELWRSDGTATGTALVKEIAPGDSSSSPSQFQLYDARLFFVADDFSNGGELWVTDGTEDGTECDAVAGTPAEEVCDDLDNDCDGSTDESATDAFTWYLDGDSDGYGDPGAPNPDPSCTQPAAGHVTDATDCDDATPSIHPGAVEVGCDGLDNDCDPVTLDVVDADGDGLACDVDCDDASGSCTIDCSDANGDGVADCAEPAGDGDGDGTFDVDDCDDDDPNNWTSCASCVDSDDDTYFLGCDAYMTIAGPDCDDTRAAVHPDGWESCDTLDNDCDGSFDEDTVLLTRLENPGQTALARFGASVARIHDVDGDGAGDFVVGAPNDTIAGLAEAGSATVFSSGTLRPIHELVHPGPAAGDHFGIVVAPVSDLSGDGIGEIIVGADGDDAETGIAFVFSGSAAAGFELLYPLLDPTGAPGDRFASSASGLGDFDGDTVPEIIVGAPGVDGNRGSAIVFSGASGAMLRRLTDPLGNADDLFGHATAGVGDITGDGVPDVVVGAHGSDTPAATGAGVVLAFSGASGAIVRRIFDAAGETGDEFGRSVANAGDLDGDGWDDVIIGTPGDDVAALGTDAGSVSTFSPATGTRLATSTAPEGRDDDRLGISVARIGDVDGDTVPDLVAGAVLYDTSGSALLFSGASLAAAAEFSYVPGGPDQGFGASVSAVDDVDGDGLPDILIGALQADPEGREDAGRVFVYSSRLAEDTDGDGTGDLCDADDDRDGHPDIVDCSPQDAASHSGASEINDGRDNQCDGDPGYGLIDELSGTSGFLDPGDKTRYSWPPQQGATLYDVARSEQRTFATCVLFPTDTAFLDDPTIPAAGTVFYYLSRSASPRTGSWGARSLGLERILSCGG